MDEKLNNIIERVTQLSNENPEFKQRLLMALKIPSQKVYYNNKDSRIDEIEKYLALDYKFDFKESVSIDYSFISDERVRDKLESDNREMQRFRHGTRYHEIIYDKFCLFAHLQAEGLVNYWYERTFCGDMERVANFIEENNHAYYYSEPDEEKEKIKMWSLRKIKAARSLSAIPYSQKMYSLMNFWGIEKSLQSFLFGISNIRNNTVHSGGKTEEEKSSQEFYNKEKQLEEFVKKYKENFNVKVNYCFYKLQNSVN